ncbi:MAG: sulfotransferase family protein [Gammaproteobacteria bacterium]
MALRIIGAGLGRTGTMSMKLALEQLGLGRCYHMAELIADPSRMPSWLKVTEGTPDWETIFAGFTATVDYPACTYWRELMAAYPEAKVLLTVRDPNDWFDSTQATIFSPPMRARIAGSPMEAFFRKAVYADFGDRIDDRGFMTAAFERHTAAVRGSVPPERLLVYETGEGWPRLCQFLGVAVPASPFPRVNSREEMQRMMAGAGPGASPGMATIEEMGAKARQGLSKP